MAEVRRGGRRVFALAWVAVAYAAIVAYGQVNEVAAMVAVIGGSFGFCVALHELGHAVVAALLRTRVHHVSIGWGPLLGSVRVRSTNVELRAVPTEGFVAVSTHRAVAIRARMVATFLAGPAANLAVVTAVAVLRPSGAFWPTVALTNAWLALGSLLPIHDPDRGIRTDGHQMLQILFARRAHFRTLVDQGAYHEADVLAARGDVDGALALLATAADPDPEDAAFDTFAAGVCATSAAPALERGQVDVAERLARRALRRRRSGTDGAALRTTLATAILEGTDLTGPSRPDDPRLLAALDYAEAAVSGGGGEAARLVLRRVDQRLHP